MQESSVQWQGLTESVSNSRNFTRRNQCFHSNWRHQVRVQLGFLRLLVTVDWYRFLNVHRANLQITSMSPPAEVLSHIFSFLQLEPAALQACLESHPSLFRLVQPHLYSHINFNTDSSSPRPADLTEVLSKRPYTVHYIRSLEINLDSGLDFEIQQHRLEEISTILPNLLVLREITLSHSLCPFWGWEAQPECFRLAFLECLRLQSMRDVCISDVLHFPFKSALNGECKSIRSLTVHGLHWVHPSSSIYLNVDLDGSFTNRGLPLKSLCLQRCTEKFLQGFVPWLAASRPQLWSLEFHCFHGDGGYDFLPMLLSSSSNSLTSLELDLGLGRTRMSLSWHLQSNIAHSYLPVVGYYDFNTPIIHGATSNIPVTLFTLPHLEQLTIRATLHYCDYTVGPRQWGFYSPIPAITQFFSSPNTSSLKRLDLNFIFSIGSQNLVQTESLPWFLLSEVICTPLVHLLSTISASECSGPSSAVSIQVDHRLEALNRQLTTHESIHRAIPLNVMHAFLSCSKELMQFVEQGRLIVTPPFPTSLNVDFSDCW